MGTLSDELAKRSGAPNLGGGQDNGATMHQVLDPDFGDGHDEARVAALLRRRDTARR